MTPRGRRAGATGAGRVRRRAAPDRRLGGSGCPNRTGRPPTAGGRRRVSSRTMRPRWASRKCVRWSPSVARHARTYSPRRCRQDPEGRRIPRRRSRVLLPREPRERLGRRHTRLSCRRRSPGGESRRPKRSRRQRRAATPAALDPGAPAAQTPVPPQHRRSGRRTHGPHGGIVWYKHCVPQAFNR